VTEFRFQINGKTAPSALFIFFDCLICESPVLNAETIRFNVTTRWISEGQYIYAFRVRIAEDRAAFLRNVIRLVFVMKRQCVYSEVGN
jgi:hypothetical protein